MTPADKHNVHVPRIFREIVDLCDREPSAICIFVESLLYAAGYLQFPRDPRNAAVMIQEMADAAIDRTAAQ